MAVIEVDRLEKRYGDTVAVEEVSFDVAEGELFGILGRNGAGKTTTVECIEGLRRPDAGTVRVLGLDPARDRKRLRRVLGAQLQEARLPDKLRVGEALELYRSFHRDGADPRRLAEELGLGAVLDTAFEDLSGGQQQRLSVALALVGDPQVAVLDEVTSGLDPQARRRVWQLLERIRASGVTMLLVTHLMEEAARLCDRIAVIDRGRVVAVDTPAGLVRRAAPRHRLRFRPDRPFEHRVLEALPQVAEVTAHPGGLTVTGTDDLVYAVTAALVRHEVVPLELQVQQPSLEDAFLVLTGQADPTPDRDEEAAA